MKRKRPLSKPPKGGQYLSAEQAAVVLGVHMMTMYKWLNEGRVIGKKLGRLWRIRPQDLDRSLGFEKIGGTD